MRRPTVLERPAPAEPPRRPPGLDAPRADRALVRRAVRLRRRAASAEVRRFTRRTRRRSVVAAAAAGLLVLAVLVPVLLAVSPAFAVRRIAVTGASPAVAASVRSSLADQLGTPLALVDPALVGRRMRAVARVQRYAIADLPPDTLAIQVTERTPVVQEVGAGEYRLVDAAGVVLDTAPTPFLDVPPVTLPASGAAAALDAATRVYTALPAPTAASVTAIRAAGADDVRLTLRSGQRVLWGGADHGAEKAAALAAALVKAARTAHTIDVSAPGVVSVR